MLNMKPLFLIFPTIAFFNSFGEELVDSRKREIVFRSINVVIIKVLIEDVIHFSNQIIQCHPSWGEEYLQGIYGIDECNF